MATLTPTFYDAVPVGNVKVRVFYVASATAADTFTASGFSSIWGGVGVRTPATGTAVTLTFSTTTCTIGSGPSAEAFTGIIWGVG